MGRFNVKAILNSPSFLSFPYKVQVFLTVWVYLGGFNFKCYINFIWKSKSINFSSTKWKLSRPSFQCETSAAQHVSEFCLNEYAQWIVNTPRIAKVPGPHLAQIFSTLLQKRLSTLTFNYCEYRVHTGLGISRSRKSENLPFK